MSSSNPASTSWVPIGDGTVSLLLPSRETRLIALLRECQFALTGPAELRQRIENEIGPKPRRECPNPYCDGTGWIITDATATMSAYRVPACKVGPHD